ncbi:MAG: DUF1080 domain-containing protein [Lentisphaeria bacterium]|nr:DUF1080 domain-containing protein [Lentisphaeria bacterium]
MQCRREIGMVLMALGSLLVARGLHAEEWESLVGKTLDEHWTTEGAWVLQEDGVIHLPTQEYKHWRNYRNYLVLKDRKMADFEIEFEWRAENNSGLYFHIPDLAKVDERRHVEVQIFENSKWPKAKPLGDHAAGGVIPGHPPTSDACRPVPEWNTFRIRCVGNQLTVTLNDTVVNQVDLSQGPSAKRATSGGFAFQDHGYALWLRNIRLRNLDRDAKALAPNP